MKSSNKKTRIKDFFLSPLKSFKGWKNYERKCVGEVDKVIVIVEEAKKRLLKSGISKKKITVISNVVDVDNFSDINTDATIPHKLFQYMLEGKPVVVSSCTPLKRMVEETNNGLVFEAGNAKELADKIIDLYNNKNLRGELGKNGKKAIQGRYIGGWKVGSL